ncbi:hypothetical protein GPECTOR_777g956 [Gonium pectorale]|uniref:Uncharacterized protein n=1 Tax=Gonium pectorale TaxID=33097 RepID=A0A150FU22_GONPE|nr:hypothetical protein GPECTOR_777g956 [Gonium pectorale]|eukprot:KXZ41114.1 hypothetical protein GPECTOR_777g956 [Gonium pectorale]
MAYTGRGFQRTWTYEPSADDHNARVGKILSGNLDLQSSMRSKALAELTAQEGTYGAASTASGPASASALPGLNSRVPDSRRPTLGSLARGHVWVDPNGNYLSPVSTGRIADDPAALAAAAEAEAAAAAGLNGGARRSGGLGTGATASNSLAMSSRRRATMTERQAACAALTPTERSMTLWRRLNPGCVEQTTRMPKSTFRDHFRSGTAPPPGGGPVEAVDVLDKTNHFRKTDFSEYTEVKLRLMQHLKS